MGSRGAWCKQQGCLTPVDTGWGHNQCTRCRGYYCQAHLEYDPTAQYCEECADVAYGRAARDYSWVRRDHWSRKR